MAHLNPDRVLDSTTTTGTGNITVSGNAPIGYITFSQIAGIATNDTFYYSIQHQTENEWETGIGTWQGSNVIARTTIISSSNSGAAVNFSAGTKDIFIGPLASRVVQLRPDGTVDLPAGSTLNGGAFGGGLPLVGNGATVTVSTPLLDLSQTWNAGAVAFTGWKLNITDTSSASGSLLMDLQVGGVSKVSVRKDGIVYAEGGFFSTGSWTGMGMLGGSQGTSLYSSGTEMLRVNNSGTNLGDTAIGFGASHSSNDVILTRDASNTLAQRNGTNAQTFRLYNTWSNAGVDYERGFMRWISNRFEIGTESGGSGVARGLDIYPASKQTVFHRGIRGEFMIESGAADGGDPYIKATGSSYHLLLSANGGYLKLYGNQNNTGGGVLFVREGGDCLLEMNDTKLSLMRHNGVSYTIEGGGRAQDGTDDAQGTFVIKSRDRPASAYTNFPAGGHIQIKGANGASGATSQAAHGGNIILTPGTGYGTGNNGRIIMDNLPTSSAGLPTGALWNDTGTLKVA